MLQSQRTHEVSLGTTETTANTLARLEHRGDALAVEPMGSAEPGHPGSHYDDVWHWHVTASLNFYGLDFVTAVK